MRYNKIIRRILVKFTYWLGQKKCLNKLYEWLLDYLYPSNSEIHFK